MWEMICKVCSWLFVRAERIEPVIEGYGDLVENLRRWNADLLSEIDELRRELAIATKAVHELNIELEISRADRQRLNAELEAIKQRLTASEQKK